MKKPFLHLYIIVKIKTKTKSKIVDKAFLKGEIARILNYKGGLSKWTTKYIIEDMVSLGMIIPQNKTGLYLLNDCHEEKKINNLINFGL